MRSTDELVEILVPNGKFEVSEKVGEEFVSVPAEVHCHADMAADQTPMTSCKMFVKASKAELNLLKLTVNFSSDLEVKSKTATKGDFIETSEFKLELGSVNAEDSNVNLEILDKTFKFSQVFDFGLRWWPSYVDYNHAGS